MGRPGSYTFQKSMPCEATKAFTARQHSVRQVQGLRLLLPFELIHLHQKPTPCQAAGSLTTGAAAAACTCCETRLGTHLIMRAEGKS